MDAMDRVDTIYQRHVAALVRIGACGDAVRLSLRLALEELEEGARGEAGGLIARIERVLQMHDSALHKDLIAGDIELPTAIDALIHSLTVALATANQQVATLDKQLAGMRDEEVRTAAFHQMTQIGAWLDRHADWRGEGMEIADAMIAFAEDKLAVIRSLEYQVAAKQAEIERLTRQADRWTREIEASRAAIAHASEMAAIQIPAVTVAANGATPDPTNGGIARSTWLRDDDRDWLEGLERGAHSFRTVPKETRRRLVQAHIDAVRTDSEAPRQFDFDQARPAWMPTAGSAAATFGIAWGDLCAAKDLPY